MIAAAEAAAAGCGPAARVNLVELLVLLIPKLSLAALRCVARCIRAISSSMRFCFPGLFIAMCIPRAALYGDRLGGVAFVAVAAFPSQHVSTESGDTPSSSSSSES
jgi:hypothetical protein